MDTDSDGGLTDEVGLWETRLWNQGECVGQNHGERVKPIYLFVPSEEALVAQMAGGAVIKLQILNSLLKLTTEGILLTAPTTPSHKALM